MQRFFNQLIPFILAGIALVAFAFGIMLLAYLFLFGAILGFILFIISWVRTKLFTSKNITKSGRTIDSNDWRKM